MKPLFTFLALTLLSVGLFAQSTPVTPSTDLPDNFFFAGVAADTSGTSTSNVNGVFSIATRINSNDTLPTYSLSTSDVGFVKNSTGKFVATSTYRTGIATVIYHKGGLSAFILGDGGAAVTATNVGFALSAGGGVAYNLGSKYKNFQVVAIARNTMSTVGQTQYGKVEFGLGRSF